MQQSSGHGDQSTTIWVGTYREKGGLGLYPVTCSPSGDRPVREPFDGAQNASFGAWSARHRLHYLLDEQNGTLGVYRHQDGWVRIACVETGGSQPCYAALDANETRLAVANYGSGSVALFSLDPATGLPHGIPQVRSNAGNGPHPDRQEGPHAHCAVFSPDQRWLYQADLGTDEILSFPIEPRLGDPRCAFRAPPGSGPRHLLFHARGAVVFLVSELASTVHLLERDGARLGPKQRLSTLPAVWSGDSLGGHIGMNSAGDRLYVTNRGHDSIAVFAFDGQRLSPLQHVGSGGSSPRHFLLLEEKRLMLVANEEGGNVTGFEVADDGTLRPAGIDFKIPGPAFLFQGPEPVG